MTHTIWGKIETEDSHSGSGGVGNSDSHSTTAIQGLIQQANVEFKDYSTSGSSSAFKQDGSSNSWGRLAQTNDTLPHYSNAGPSASFKLDGSSNSWGRLAQTNDTLPPFSSAGSGQDEAEETLHIVVEDEKGEEDACEDTESEQQHPQGDRVSAATATAMHLVGRCKPCRYVQSSKGCRYGEACVFCHLDHSKSAVRPSLEKRKKYKKVIDRLGAMKEQDPQRFTAALEKSPDRNVYLNDMMRRKFGTEVDEAANSRQQGGRGAPGMRPHCGARQHAMQLATDVVGGSSGPLASLSASETTMRSKNIMSL